MQERLLLGMKEAGEALSLLPLDNSKADLQRSAREASRSEPVYASRRPSLKNSSRGAGRSNYADEPTF
jgi:hypothetical protein